MIVEPCAYYPEFKIDLFLQRNFMPLWITTNRGDEIANGSESQA
jgi:hypothetical protein